MRLIGLAVVLTGCVDTTRMSPLIRSEPLAPAKSPVPPMMTHRHLPVRKTAAFLIASVPRLLPSRASTTMASRITRITPVVGVSADWMKSEGAAHHWHRRGLTGAITATSSSASSIQQLLDDIQRFLQR
jgi:hypothetical protein